jgi:hypothetical protein
MGRRMKHLLSSARYIAGVFALTSLIAFQGCATGQPGEAVNHSLEIASSWDSNRDIQYIGFCYGEPSEYQLAKYEYSNCSVETSTIKASNGNGKIGVGPMLIRKTLWVKWRNLKTGKVFEETVDLQKTWPNGFKDWLIYAEIKKDRLQVFVISIHPWQQSANILNLAIRIFWRTIVEIKTSPTN